MSSNDLLSRYCEGAIKPVASVDLNADLGEGESSDVELLGIVTSCNVACGGHAGDAASMQNTVAAALELGVAIGAHPSYPDRDGFGRRSNFMEGDALLSSLEKQINALLEIAAANAAVLQHVKPHGALYNDAARDAKLAELVVTAIARSAPGASLVGLPGSELQKAAVTGGLNFIAEGFIDRAYRADGQLLPRSEPGAVHAQLDVIVQQALELVGTVDTLCIHGDTVGAADAAAAVRNALLNSGVELRAVGR